LMRGAGGRDIHPSSTHGVLIRVYPDGSVAQPENTVAQAPNYSGIQKVIVATRDAGLAYNVYSQGLGLPADPPQADLDRGVVSSIVRPPQGGIIELASPIDTSKAAGAEIGEFLNSNGEGICCLVLSADDDVPERDISLFGTRILIS